MSWLGVDTMFISESETQETTGPEKMQMTHIMVIIGINYLTYSRIDMSPISPLLVAPSWYPEIAKILGQ